VHGHLARVCALSTGETPVAPVWPHECEKLSKWRKRSRARELCIAVHTTTRAPISDRRVEFGRRRRFSEEFKRDAVRLVVEEGYTLKAAAVAVDEPKGAGVNRSARGNQTDSRSLFRAKSMCATSRRRPKQKTSCVAFFRPTPSGWLWPKASTHRSLWQRHRSRCRAAIIWPTAIFKCVVALG
jgi:hypothetical protein